jgi:hypothetical protein
MMGDCSGFYKLQMTDKNWQSLFKLMALKSLKVLVLGGQVVQAECSRMPFRDLSFDCVLSNQAHT